MISTGYIPSDYAKNNVMYVAYDTPHFIKSKTHSFPPFNSMKSGLHFLITTGSTFFLVVHKTAVCLTNDGILDPMKYRTLVNKFPKGGIIYKAINRA